ncbi:hypothetical protein TNCV_3612561 [Trichonephila clavipes]|uniref:Uncharacterized protein n=1 Tax=Trichonephila clavipes TaxID=2585209 RepID=A0A8X6SRT0_TRICX|nr:hypothetical protein TNCV_3612561 [Trichonephila clavipes]
MHMKVSSETPKPMSKKSGSSEGSKLRKSSRRFFLRLFQVWDVEGMVLVVSRTGFVSADKAENIDTVDEEIALFDEDDAIEVHRLLDVERAESIKGISG